MKQKLIQKVITYHVNKIAPNTIIFLLALLINGLIFFAFPLIQYFNGQPGIDPLSSKSEIKAVKINLKQTPPKKKKLLLKKNQRPKSPTPNKMTDRFQLNLTVSSGLGDGIATQQPGKNIIYNEGEVDIDPIRIGGRLPKIPDQFIQLNLEGKVDLEILINENGNVETAKVLREQPPAYGLKEEALEVVRSWKFRPALVNKIPVKIRVIIPLIF